MRYGPGIHNNIGSGYYYLPQSNILISWSEQLRLKTFSFRGEEGTKDVLSITFRVPIAFKPCHESSPKKSSSQPPDLRIIFGFAAGRELVELWDCISDNVCFPLFSLRSLCLATWREIERAGSYHFESSESNCIFSAPVVRRHTLPCRSVLCFLCFWVDIDPLVFSNTSFNNCQHVPHNS